MDNKSASKSSKKQDKKNSSSPNSSSSSDDDGTPRRSSVEVVLPDSSSPTEEVVKVQHHRVSDEEISKDNREGLLKVFTKAIGIDITTITLPVTVCEPASFLMRLCEAIQYSELLDKASECDNSLERLMYITTFATSIYSVAERTGKPFNPFLGETYEYVDENRENFRFIAEQVSHHPPVGACHAENDNWIFWQSQCLKSKFAGNSLDCSVVGTTNVVIKRTNEHFKWESVKTSVHNIIVGKIWLDHYGEAEIVNKATGEKAKLKMKQCGWFSKGWHEMEADIIDAKGSVCITLSGKWNDSVFGKVRNASYDNNDNSGVSLTSSGSTNNLFKDSTNPSSTTNASESSKDQKKELKKEKKQQKKDKKEFKKEIKKKLTSNEALWVHTFKPLPADKVECKYANDWSAHTFELVKLDDAMKAHLPPNDSRLRQDRYWLEKGDSKKAGAEKHALEERQREERRNREKEGKKWEPKYFKLATDADGQEFWQYLGGYWEAREERMKNASQK